MAMQTSARGPQALPRLALALFTTLLLAACTGTGNLDLANARFQVPQHWSGAAASEQRAGGQPVVARWWTMFGDAGLDRVVDEALQRNPDLATAALTVRQARLQADLAMQSRRPQFDASLSAQARRSFSRPRATTRSSGSNAGVGYEVDLWGRLADLVDAAQWRARASEADRQAAGLALSATAAQLYWRIGYLHEQLSSSDESLAYARRTRDLVLAQYRAGGLSSLELGEAEQTVLNQQATVLSQQQQLTEARHALALLLDLPPAASELQATLPDEPRQLPTGRLPTVAADLPASLLTRRPDVLAAEHRLRATLADQQATAASFYPSLSLTGALGTSSASLYEVLRNPFALLGVGLNLPFLNQGEVRIRSALARNEYEAAVLGWRSTFYQALEDVENALSERQTLLDQEQLLAGSLKAAQQTEALYEVRYRNGAVALRFWLDAQEARRRARLALLDNRLAQLTALATLSRALGGSLLDPVVSGETR